MKRILLVWICIIAILYATLSIVRHNHFQSGGFDLGVYDQAVWQYSKFLWPYNTIKDRFILGDHLTLTLPVLAPLFWVWNNVRVLLLFQAVWVSFSVFAVYKLVRIRKFSPLAALCVSFVYSLFYGIQYGIFFDFHPVLLAVGLIPWMLYFLESKQTKLCIGALILLLLTQENMGLALASLGFIYYFQKPYRTLSIVFVIGGITVSLLSAKIIALFSPIGFQYAPHITFNPILFMKELFNSSEKQRVWLYTMTSFSFLPLFSPGALLAIIFDLAQYFTTGPEFTRMWSPFMHHRAILTPYVLLGTLDVLGFLVKKKINITAIALFLVASCLAQQYIFHYPLNKLSKFEYWKVDSWITDDNRMIATIPPTMSIATQQNLVPHLTHRKDIFLVWPRIHDTGWWLDFDSKADYLLIDTHPGEWLIQLLETPEHVKEALANMEKLNKISLVRQINDIRLYRINH